MVVIDCRLSHGHLLPKMTKLQRRTGFLPHRSAIIERLRVRLMPVHRSLRPENRNFAALGIIKTQQKFEPPSAENNAFAGHDLGCGLQASHHLPSRLHGKREAGKSAA